MPVFPVRLCSTCTKDSTRDQKVEQSVCVDFHPDFFLQGRGLVVLACHACPDSGTMTLTLRPGDA